MSDKNNSGLEVARPDTLPSALPVVAHRVRDSWQDEWQFIEVQPKNWNCAEPLVRLSDAEAAQTEAYAEGRKDENEAWLAATGWCPNCKGSGEQEFMTNHLGPDDYSVTGNCSACAGVGTAPKPDAEALNAAAKAYLKWSDPVICKDPELRVIRDMFRAALLKAEGAKS